MAKQHDEDPIEAGRKNYIEGCERLGARPEVAVRRGDKWAAGERAKKKRSR